MIKVNVEEILTYTATIAGAVITIITLITLIIKPIRKAFINWISKLSERDSINEKLDRLSALVQTTVSQNDELKDEMEKQSKALQASLRNSILNVYNRCSDRQYITSFELQNLSQLYENYKALGGNSFISQCVERLKNLDIRNE